MKEEKTNGIIFENSKNDLKGWLESLDLQHTEWKEFRINNISYKYVKWMRKNVDKRFRGSVVATTWRSNLDLNLIPPSDSDSFKVFGNNEISCLSKYFLLDIGINSIIIPYQDFKFEISEINRKYGIFEKHFDESKLKFAQKQASTESAYKYVLVLNKESNDSLFNNELAKIASILRYKRNLSCFVTFDGNHLLQLLRVSLITA